jgi:hypothetical protein
MAATGHTVAPPQPEVLSPELVLVDPQLAAHVHAVHADHDDAVSHVEEATPADREPMPVSRPGDSGDDATAAARERLMERALDSEVLGSLVPPGRRFRRRATLIPATAAAVAVALLVVQLSVNQGKLP